MEKFSDILFENMSSMNKCFQMEAEGHQRKMQIIVELKKFDLTKEQYVRAVKLLYQNQDDCKFFYFEDDDKLLFIKDCNLFFLFIIFFIEI